MKYCNINDCRWNSRDGMCTYYSFDDDEDISDEDETRLCRIKGIRSPQNPNGTAASGYNTTEGEE